MQLASALSIDGHSGLLHDVTYYPSPNCDERPQQEDISLVVVHNISLPPRQFAGDDVIKFFCNELDLTSHPYYAALTDQAVSAHIFIRRDGEMIQFVPFHKRAWHAGQSEYEGRERVNDYSIGIELEGADQIPYEAIQYENLALLIKQLGAQYPKISTARVVGHCDIAPGRKTDPGPAFDWPLLRTLLNSQG